MRLSKANNFLILNGLGMGVWLQYLSDLMLNILQEMNPTSDRFKRMFGNPFAFVPFKATEPWLEEYITMDLLGILSEIGFRNILQEPSTPGHFSLVARKPENV